MSNETLYCMGKDVLFLHSGGESSAFFTAFLYVYLSIGIVSTFCNTMVICTLVLSKELHGTFYIILTSLFVSELITSSVIFPMLAAVSSTSRQPNCTLLNSCQYFVHTISLSSIFSMTAIAYDRYLRVAKRHTYCMFMSKTKGCIIVSSIWVAAPSLGLLSIIVSSKVIAVTALCVISLILYLYIITLKKLRSNVSRVPCNIPARQIVSHHDGGVRRSSRLVFILVSAMLLSWCPSISMSMMNDTILYVTNDYAFAAVQQLPLLSAVSSPFLYFWTNKTTRRSFVAFCLKVYCKRPDADRIVTVCT